MDETLMHAAPLCDLHYYPIEPDILTSFSDEVKNE